MAAVPKPLATCKCVCVCERESERERETERKERERESKALGHLHPSAHGWSLPSEAHRVRAKREHLIFFTALRPRRKRASTRERERACV
jgi:hypothetical protein